MIWIDYKVYFDIVSVTQIYTFKYCTKYDRTLTLGGMRTIKKKTIRKTITKVVKRVI